jgi:hypothetical protein
MQGKYEIRIQKSERENRGSPTSPDTINFLPVNLVWIHGAISIQNETDKCEPECVLSDF